MFRLLRWLTLLFLAAVVAVAVLADFGARRIADAALADHVRQQTGATTADAAIGGWPFLYRVLGQGSVPFVNLHLTEVPAGETLTLQSVDVHLIGVSLDKHRLWAQRKVALTSIQTGTATLAISAPELSAVTGHTVTVGPSGQLVVEVAGNEVPATVRTAAGDVLELSVAGLPNFRIDLARSPVVPRCDLTVVVTATGVQASCAMSPVPQSLIEVVSSRSG